MNNDLLFNLEYLNKFKEEMKKITPELFQKIVYSCSKIKEENIYYVSFNGGKDSLAAYLILKYYLYCIENDINYSHFESLNKFKENQNKIVLNKVVFLYFVSDKHFESEEDYVINFAKKEKIKIFYCYSSYVTGLNYLLKRFDIHTIIMGTRNDDIKNTLNSNIISNSLIESSTKPFPNFNRLYLVFNFSYNEIWRLILFLNSDYLDLYDKGYSSIGDRYNTKINQYLFINNREIFPAWCLLNNDSERAFR
jgi:FAD synthetase